jgi:hypothetical protein
MRGEKVEACSGRNSSRRMASLSVLTHSFMRPSFSA